LVGVVFLRTPTYNYLMENNQPKKQSLVTKIVFIIFIIAVVFIIIRGSHGKRDAVQIGQSTPQETSNTQKPMEEKVTTLQSVTKKEGTGAVAQSGNTVEMNYTGRLENGQVFDSNTDPAFHHVEPFQFVLGAGQVIKGWDQGIVGMKVGEKRTLTIPSSLAYGHQGIPGAIPPDATLIFDVELTKIVK
jgi:FKBP-type peptidyl-prolyl cis-trans isomerase